MDAEPVAPTRTTEPSTTSADAATLLAAGDVADCRSEGDEATAELIAEREGTVAVLGDAVYERGTATEFARCYAPSWGQFLDRTRPAIGNHEYGTDGGAPYFRYFGEAAGEPGEGWYSYELGSWHIVVLNSNCRRVSCGVGGPQHRWLVADLAKATARCTLAYWHHPRFSSGLHGSTEEMAALYEALYDAGGDVVLAGHDHSYERFAPLDPRGRADAERGIRSFVVGTGGKSHYPFPIQLPGSEARTSEMFGVLVLTLETGRYAWEFVPVPGRDFEDAGTGSCH